MSRLAPLLALFALACTPESIPEGCRAGLPRPEVTRYGVVSHPYAADGSQADTWEVLALDADGTLSLAGQPFTMGRSVYGPVRFSPDGSLGVAVQEDGSLGLFALQEGLPRVIDSHFADDGAGGAFYVSDVRFDPSGERLWVVDGNWRENGGGIYAVDLDCETGAPTSAGLVAPSKLGAHLLPLSDGRHLYVADDVLDVPAGEHAHLVDLSVPAVEASAALWPDDEAITGGAALSGDEGYVLVGDVSAFSGVPNRVAVARIDEGGLTAEQVLSPIEDPAAIATWGEATLVASGFGDALFQLSHDPDGAEPFAVTGEIAYTGGSPQIPSSITVAEAEDGDAWMLVTEVSAIRRVQASPDGTLADRGVFGFGSGLERIVGAFGLQP